MRGRFVWPLAHSENEMKKQIQWLALVMTFVLGIAGSMGCATMAASSMVNSGDSDFYYKPVLSDEIVAIGRPDTALAKELGNRMWSLSSV